MCWYSLDRGLRIEAGVRNWLRIMLERIGRKKHRRFSVEWILEKSFLCLNLRGLGVVVVLEFNIRSRRDQESLR